MPIIIAETAVKYPEHLYLFLFYVNFTVQYKDNFYSPFFYLSIILCPSPSPKFCAMAISA